MHRTHIGRQVNVKSRSEDGEDFTFQLSKKLARQTAVVEVEKYALAKTGPQFKTLSENELRICERMAVGDRV